MASRTVDRDAHLSVGGGYDGGTRGGGSMEAGVVVGNKALTWAESEMVRR